MKKNHIDLGITMKIILGEDAKDEILNLWFEPPIDYTLQVAISQKLTSVCLVVT